MTQEVITKRITSSQQSMFLAKLRNFFRKSVLKYLLASGLIAIGIPNFFGGFVLTFLGFFAGLCILSFIIMYTSSKIQARKLAFDASVTFEESIISIQHLNKTLIEKKEWNWIVNAQENKYGYFLMLQKYPKIELILLKSNLTEEETKTFRSFLVKNSLVT